MHRLTCFVVLLLSWPTMSVCGQQPPDIGYVYPPGAQPGTTVEVVLGGYNWTPDMELFVHGSVDLEILEKPGSILVPEPPYWFGKKSSRGAFRLPRESRARLSVPDDTLPGIVRWQAANANGVTNVGHLMVFGGSHVIEDEQSVSSQHLASLPVVVSGQLKIISEVDCYSITTTKTGPVTCLIVARRIGSPLNAVFEVRNERNELIVDVADTAGADTQVTFNAKANSSYTLCLHDIDFRGNRSYVYQLIVSEAPRVVAVLPAAGRRGESNTFHFLGYGVATGAAQLEMVTRSLDVPADPTLDSLRYTLDTPFGTAAPFEIPVSDVDELFSPNDEGAVTPLPLPGAVTSVLRERYGKHRYHVKGKQGDKWVIHVAPASNESPVRLSLGIHGPSADALAYNDEMTVAESATLTFDVPADGVYTCEVVDLFGLGGPLAVYHLTLQHLTPGFTLTGPAGIGLPLGEETKLTIDVKRIGDVDQEINLEVNGCPTGVGIPESLTVPAGATKFELPLGVDSQAATHASMVTITGTMAVNDRLVRQTTDPILLAITMKPPFSIDAEGRDDVAKWPRGTTYPAPILVQRDEGFTGEIMLEMQAQQVRTRQGISAPDYMVPGDVVRVLYPIFLPEWLETTRTSRLVTNGVGVVKDPHGISRYLVSPQKTRTGFLPVGAILKLHVAANEFVVNRGETFFVPLRLSRNASLGNSLKIALMPSRPGTDAFSSPGLELLEDQRQVDFPILVTEQMAPGEYQLTICATGSYIQQLPVISETNIIVQVLP